MEILLAPMEGLLDCSLRDVLTRVGGVSRCVSEFIRVTDAVLPDRAFKRVMPELMNGGRTPAGVPVRAQLLGSDPIMLAENARSLARLGPAGIDLNFGCPAKVVNRHGGGAALLETPELIHQIVSAVRKAVPMSMPVSAKMRLGFNDDSRAEECAKAIEDAGADELVVHARTKAHGYRPPAYWSRIADVRAAVRIPVIANGEVWTVDDALQCLQESGCDALMLGRGMVVNPGLALAILARQGLSDQGVVPWSRLLPLLEVYWQLIVPRVEPRHRPGRLKQWLNYLRRHHPEAEQAYQEVRTLSDSRQFEEWLAHHRPPLCGVATCVIVTPPSRKKRQMPIQWFPGHMNVTKKAIIERIKDIDVVIELLDARLPGSSANPMLEQLTGHRLKLKVLNKQDLADATQTETWLAWYNAQPNTRAIALDAGETAPAQRLIKACRELAPHRGGMAKPLRVMICGIPNVGKSTLMNTLVGRKAAKTGDEAGVTRIEQRINLASDFYLFDTPGMLWPKITVDQSGYHLAASGAVGRNAYEDEDVSLELLKSLRAPYAAMLAARFKFDDVAAIPETDEEVLLSEVGRKRGAVMSGGRINVAKAAEIVLHDFRAGLIGRITLETPEQFAQWWAEGQAKEAEREAIKLARKQKKHSSRQVVEADTEDDAQEDATEEEDESNEG